MRRAMDCVIATPVSRKAAAEVPAFAPPRLRVLIADDHSGVRQALTRLLQAHLDIEVIGSATDGEEAVALAGQLKPDVVIMDVQMPRLSGIEATRQLTAKCPWIRVIGFCIDSCGHQVAAMRAAGAVACLDKAGGIQPVLAAIRLAQPERKRTLERLPPPHHRFRRRTCLPDF